MCKGDLGQQHCHSTDEGNPKIYFSICDMYKVTTDLMREIQRENSKDPSSWGPHLYTYLHM